MEPKGEPTGSDMKER